jgi:DNA-binding response OmpR family regulator
MQIGEPPTTVIFVSRNRPEPGVEDEMEACGLYALWAPSIARAAPLFNSLQDRAVVITELALVDGNWRDLVEQVRFSERPIPIMLLASVRTAELWWDALDCGVEDILLAPLSGRHLCPTVMNIVTARKSNERQRNSLDR